MSDSIFITAENTELFLSQLSSFLMGCFLYNGIDVPYTWEHGHNSPPVLFRGGLASGEVTIIEPTIIINNGKKTSKNLLGMGIVDAVSLEKIGTGPNIFCDEKFYNVLSVANKKYFILAEQTIIKEKYRENNYYQLLWPISFFDGYNDDTIAKNNIFQIIIPAAILNSQYKGTNNEHHYRAFLQLVIYSILKYFENSQILDDVKSQIDIYASSHKFDDLIESKFIKL